MLTRVMVRSAALAALLCWIPSPALAQRGDPTKNDPKVHEAFRGVVAKVNGSVVRVVSNGKDAALGTIVGADGWVLTKNSQLGNKVEVKLPGSAEALPAKVVGVKDDYDLALLKIDAKGLPVVKWQPTKDFAPGDWVVAAGTDKAPLAVGVVSVATRKMGRRDYPPQTNPNSGFLGINLAENPDGGVKIGVVQKDMAAEKAGLKAGDVILAIEGKPIADPETLQATIGRYKPKDVITIKFKRDGKEDEVKATLSARPANLSRGDFQNRMGNEMSDRRAGFPAILQHDTLVKPIDCGGPLLDLDGRVLGINIARAGRVETYTIPSENVVAILDELKSGKLAPPTVVKGDKEKAAVKEAEERFNAAEQRKVAAQKLLKSADEAAEKFGKDNPDLIEARERAKKLVAASEKTANDAKSALDKARAELEKAMK